jgi:hypothetical protein
MSTNYAQTPADKLRKPKGEKDGKQQVHVTDWCSHHDVCMWLMPFDYRTYDPLEACRNIKNTLQELPPYTQTIMGKDLGVSHIAGTEIMGPVIRLYKITDLWDTSKGQRYRNPNYEHYDECIDPITDREARLEFYDRYKHNPYLDSPWYAKHWGVSRERVTQFLQQHGTSIQEDRATARRRLARSLYTIIQWRDDLCQADLCRLMPPKHKTVKVQIRRYARTAEEWQPPERPTHKPWFRSD